MTANKALLALLGAAVLVPALLVLELTWAIPSHDRQLRQLARRYEAVEHPPDSAPLHAWRAIGILDGAGNHCDFIAGEQRTSALPPGQIRAFYAATDAILHFPGLPEAQDNYAVDHIRFETPGGWPPGSYAVYLYDGPHDPAGDWRCT